MSSWLEFEDKIVENAVLKASEELGIPKDKLKYDVISYGSTGIFGLVGVKKARIRVSVPENGKGGRVKNKKVDDSDSWSNNDDMIQSQIDPVMTDASQLVKEAFGEEEPSQSDEDPLKIGKEILERIIDFITTGATIKSEKKEGRIRFQVEGGNSAVLIGKHGQTLEAIQYLVEKIVNKQHSDRIRVQVDVEGYLENRRLRLTNLASRLAEKAKQTGRPSTIGQLNSHDRRIVHLALKDDGSVRTQSMGDGMYRKLVIYPKKRGVRKKGPVRN